jgi:hypothetical protein
MDRWDFEPTTCGSEDLKCNNNEINHSSSQIEACLIIIIIIIARRSWD